MKTITLVAFNRLHYLKRLVESLKLNNLEGYELFIGVEPDDLAVVEYCRSLDFMPIHSTINPTRLGVRENPRATISRTFEAGSEFNLALEDDLVLAPDALDLAEWFRELRDNPFFCLNLFNYRSSLNEPEAIEEASHFVALGWAVGVNIWRRWIASNWLLDERGWDFSLNAVLSQYAPRKLLRPKLARANHVGRAGGVHCSPDFHDQVFAQLPLSDGTRRDYRLCV